MTEETWETVLSDALDAHFDKCDEASKSATNDLLACCGKRPTTYKGLVCYFIRCEICGKQANAMNRRNAIVIWKEKAS
jgi:hypothetical protein